MSGVLNEIAADAFSIAEASNQPMFTTDVDYDELVTKREVIVKNWSKMDADGRSKFANLAAYEKAEGAPDLKAEGLIPAKNYSLLRNEIKKRVASSEVIKLLQLDALNFDEFALELAESVENVDEIKDLYRLRKRNSGISKNAGIGSEEAMRLKNCFAQGRELYLAGKAGSLMVKPLNFFYALTAYSYGIIVLNNPIRYNKGNLPGSHGMTYIPDTVQAQFGGDSAKGTFSDLVVAFPTQLIKTSHIEFNIDCAESIVALYHNKINVSVGTLLSMVPEMSEYYKITTGRTSRCYPLEIVNAPDLRNVTWQFQIGDGETRPNIAHVSQAFPGFEITEKYGKVLVSVPASRASTIKACVYTDVRGALWFIENPFFPIILPEVATHFLITSMFSNIMRYRPDEWGSVLSNEVSSNISLISRHYFSSFQRKFFPIVLGAVSRYLPYVS